ncbi:MAG: hypothetical protein NTU61_03530 [Candidatus Altiarchaeota archaeon]|nr:hypothetical protein [Candidatus Altiarchaeota archaeon]
MKKIAITILILAIITQASATRVGVVAQFPDGTMVMKGVEVNENATGYEVANAAGLGVTWGGPHPLFGHSLCKINGIGTEPNPTGCEWTGESWAYWIIRDGSSSWTSMPVGHDGGASCWNRNPYSWDGHYCATEGDIVGYVFGPYDPVTWEPPKLNSTPRFTDIFQAGGSRGAAFDYFIGYAVLPTPEGSRLTVFDNKTNQTIRGAVVELFSGDPGFTEKLYEAKTDRNGSAEVQLPPKQYGVRITAYRYHQLYTSLLIEQSTTTSTTETTTTTLKTESTTTLKHFIIEESTTTTATSSTTTLKQPEIIGNIVAQTPNPENNRQDYLPYVLIAVIIALPVIAKLMKG